MKNLIIPTEYHSALNLHDTQIAIKTVKDFFQSLLSQRLSLSRVSAPLFVDPDTGLNDNLNGVERPVSFGIREQDEKIAEVVHSLAKWKRFALKKYGFAVNEGLYTDMNAIRRDEDTDNIHSIFVDQWDWEKIITREERNTDFLKKTVRSIVDALSETQSFLCTVFPQLNVLPQVSTDVTFITTQELEDLFPDKTPKEREDAFVKDHPTTFLMGIGGKLKSGKPHDGRAPDYDDWDLNGDLLVWDSVGRRSFELSSMGIRVDEESLARQLELAGCESRRELPFHKMLLNGELPLTMGGGIGQSRVSMLLLGKAHIGEVQSSLWDEANIAAAEKAGITLL